MPLSNTATTLPTTRATSRSSIKSILGALKLIKGKTQSMFIILYSLQCTDNVIRYKHRVVCFLLSHANATPLQAMQIGLLDTIATISDKSRLQILLPTFEALTSKAAQDQTNVSEGLSTRLMSTFDASAAAYLNDNAGAWDMFILVIRRYLSSGACFCTLCCLSGFSNPPHSISPSNTAGVVTWHRGRPVCRS